LSGPGIKVPCREPWENKSFKRRRHHGNQEESRQEKETLSGSPDARSEFSPSLSGEAPLERLFRENVCYEELR
jgi:hypothetical protein